MQRNCPVNSIPYFQPLTVTPQGCTLGAYPSCPYGYNCQLSRRGDAYICCSTPQTARLEAGTNIRLNFHRFSNDKFQVFSNKLFNYKISAFLSYFLAMCNLPQVIGTCGLWQYRYWFNPVTRQCEVFQWSGCDANRNNFFDYAECFNACGYLSPAGVSKK